MQQSIVLAMVAIGLVSISFLLLFWFLKDRAQQRRKEGDYDRNDHDIPSWAAKGRKQRP